MIEVPVFGPQRAAVLKLIIESSRGFARSYFNTENLGENATEIVIAGFIFVGQAENKAMTAGDISVCIGFPRATVHRYLKDMEDRGIIHSAMQGRRRVFGLRNVNAPHLFPHLAQVRDRMQMAADALSHVIAQIGQLKSGNK